MLGLDPEGPVPLDVLCAMGDPGVAHILAAWQGQGIPTPISGDPHFRRPRVDSAHD